MEILAVIVISILLVTLLHVADTLDWKTGKVSCSFESIIFAILAAILDIF
jgi:hypothetical protein